MVTGVFALSRRATDFDRGGVIQGVLRHFLNGCIDPLGRRVWRSLLPLSEALSLPPAWSEQGYVGCTCQYRLIQSPEDNCWI